MNNSRHVYSIKVSFILLFSVFVITFVNAQSVKVAQRVYVGSDITQEQALEKGLKAAKSEALVKAGVTEYISEYTRLLTSEVNDNINEVFNSDLLIHLGGTIKHWHYISGPTFKFDQQKEMPYWEFEIKVKVKKYKSKPDRTFKAKISGLKGSYVDGDWIEFSIFPFKEAYLSIFYISDNEASILFPYEDNQKTLIKANENKIIDYLVAERNKNYESGRLITVITKEYYPYDAAKKDNEGFETKTTVEDVFRWILDIEPKNRTEYYHEFFITQ
jgi:hypothetical protein